MSILLHLRTSWALKEQPLKKKKKQQKNKNLQLCIPTLSTFLKGLSI